MRETSGKQLGLTEGTCPHYQRDFSGYCEGCVQRGDCMLQAILHKVESLETRMDGLTRVTRQHSEVGGTS